MNLLKALSNLFSKPAKVNQYEGAVYVPPFDFVADLVSQSLKNTPKKPLPTAANTAPLPKTSEDTNIDVLAPFDYQSFLMKEGYTN